MESYLELGEELCEYCRCTDYGAEEPPKVTKFNLGCEGNWCEEAYQKYKEDINNG